jgi:hypothetical protein
MIALFSALIGFISSAVPELLRLFRDSKDRAHEITLLKLQMEHEREARQHRSEQGAQEHAMRLEAIQTHTMLAEQALLNARVKESLTGIHWVDALAGSVRPVITYAFFFLYFLIKCAQYRMLMDSALPWQAGMTTAQALVSLWTEEDIAIFSAIIAFWFGQRALRRRSVA